MLKFELPHPSVGLRGPRTRRGKKMLILLTLVFLSVSSSTNTYETSSPSIDPSPPNIVIFVADDLGRYDTSITNPNSPTVRRFSYNGNVTYISI